MGLFHAPSVNVSVHIQGWMSPHKNQRNKKNCLPSCPTRLRRSDLIVAAIVKRKKKHERVGKYLQLKKLGIGAWGAGKNGCLLHLSDFARVARSKSLLGWDER
jgi:hypothetical protein